MNKYQPEGFALNIFKNKYIIHENETWEEACLRVATHISNAEAGDKRIKYKELFFNELISNRFIPAGRIWYGCGRAKSNLLNCFVIKPENNFDSREGWGQLLKDVIIISGMGGGVGIPFDEIRPRDSLIKGTGGKSTGSISLMQLINNCSDVIRGGGNRRAALLFSLPIGHPDIEEFLKKKLDKKELNNANISITIDDVKDFITKINNNDKLELNWKNEIKKEINLSETFDKIVSNTLKSGDPGIINRELMNKMNNTGYYSNIVTTNPCLSGDTFIAVADGRNAVTIKELAENGEDVPVYSYNCDKKKIEIKLMRHPRVTGNNKTLYEVKLDNGDILRVTGNHKFILKNSKEVCAKDLKHGDSLNIITKSIRRCSSNNYMDIYCNGKKINEYRIIAGNNYNHKVISVVKLEGKYDVYNGTVDDNHNYYISRNNTKSFVNTKNCGELPLPPQSACCLGSLVLPKFIIKEKDEYVFDFDLLASTITLGIRFLDNVLDITDYPLEEIKDKVLNERRIGLGFTGLHDTMIRLRLEYGSEEGNKWVDKLCNFIKNVSYDTSTVLSVEKGSFHVYDKDKILKGGFIKTLKPSLKRKIKDRGLRNAALNTLAPSGSISIVSGVSSGIEPIFAPAYVRQVKTFGKLNEDIKTDTLVIHPLCQEMFNNGIDIDHFKSAHDITPQQHIEIQKICQKHIDSSISKTINLDIDIDKWIMKYVKKFDKDIDQSKYDKLINKVNKDGFAHIPKDMWNWIIKETGLLSEIKTLLLAYLPSIKGVTFYLNGSKGQAPITPVSVKSKEVIELLKQNNKIQTPDDSNEAISKQQCRSGVCEI